MWIMLMRDRINSGIVGDPPIFLFSSVGDTRPYYIPSISKKSAYIDLFSKHPPPSMFVAC